ncbi:MAG: ribose-5-phosphate isomerase RpiA [Gammaproteobacteria bacterium]|jgi:ribose 5-phosphate isomerase A|nr:ribose-5-phosphate isomerase RpiA [Gammaproteobacteria bacterium]
MNNDHEKENAAIASLNYVTEDCILGIGTGSTVNYLIDHLDRVKHKIKSIVSSSIDSTKRLKNAGFIVDELSSVGKPNLYIDGADEVTNHLHMIKGGGGALTREKIIANASEKIICIAHNSKLVDILGRFPLPIEVIPMAKSFVAREIAILGGQAELRHGFVTDNGNIILDVHNLKILNPPELEKRINNIAGVVTNGIFSLRPADLLIIGHGEEIKVYKKE